MNKVIVIILVFVSHICFAQNLVPNPSFEDYSSCPFQIGQIGFADGWTSFRETPDYFNSCANFSQPAVGVPINTRGNQSAFNGNAYAGFFAFAKSQPNIREFLAIELSQQLQVGQQYFISFWVSLSDTISLDCAINKIGARFSTIPFSQSIPLAIDNFSHVHSDLIISDNQVWTRVAGSFISDSLYQYLILGNFYDDLNTDTAFCSSPVSSTSYFYLDAVVVSTDSVYTDSVFTSVSENNINNDISVYPNPSCDYMNIFSENSLSEIEIFDNAGRLICSKNVKSSHVKIDLRNFSNGLYLLRIKSIRNYFNKKFMIIKQFNIN